MANIPIKESPETQLNKELVNKLYLYDKILIAGEAKSHCVATTVKQILNIDGFAPKLVVLEDCMSDVKGFETLALPIYERAKKAGVEFALSTEWFK
jgi:nicotinamidase-related amidase